MTMTDLSENYPELSEAISRMRERAKDKEDSQASLWAQLGSWLTVAKYTLQRGEWPEAPSLPISVAAQFVRWDKIDRGIHFIDHWQAGTEPRKWRKAQCWCGWEALSEGSSSEDLQEEINRLFFAHQKDLF